MAKRTISALSIVAVLGVAAAAPARLNRAEAAADDCLSAPNSAPTQGRHWYFRTDRSTGNRCWYLGPRREKATEAREVAPPKPRPTSKPMSEPNADPPVEPIARTTEPVPDVPTQLQSPATSAAPIEPESAAGDRVAGEQLAMRPRRETDEQADKPPIRPVPAATDLSAGAPPNIRFEHMLALVAAALALVAGMVRQVFNLLLVRRLRRRRSALRSQWEAASTTQAPRSSAFGNMVAATHHADVHDPLAGTRSSDLTRKPTNRRDPGHDFAEHGIEDRGIDESFQRLLHDLRRAAA